MGDRNRNPALYRLSYTHRVKGSPSVLATPPHVRQTPRRFSTFSALQPRFLPQFVHAPLHVGRHLNNAWPRAGKTFAGPFFGGIDSHLRAVVRKAARMV